MKWLIFFACTWLATSSVYAAPRAVKNQPIDITSDTLEVLQQNQTAIFKGNVIARQGGFTLNAAQMKVFYSQRDDKKAKAEAPAPSGGAFGSVSKIEATGNVILVTADESAEADRGIYQVDRKQISLYGNITLSKGKNVLKGSHLEYNMVTGKSVVSSEKGAGGVKAGTGGRVRGIFIPESK